MIAVKDLVASYDSRPVLDGVSLSVAEGERVAIMGTNGAGKTTLLKLVVGLKKPDKGTVEVPGVAGFAPEDPQAGLFAETVADEVAFFPRNRGLDVAHHREQALAAFDLEPLSDRDPYSLSVGEQRRVSIASVLAGDPATLLLDEPTRGLDAAGERTLAERLLALDVTILFSTHSTDFAYEVADRVAVLGDGRLRRDGPVRDVLSDIAFLRSAGVRPPGIVRWARAHGIDPPPADLEEAIARLEATP